MCSVPNLRHVATLHSLNLSPSPTRPEALEKKFERKKMYFLRLIHENIRSIVQYTLSLTTVEYFPSSILPNDVTQLKKKKNREKIKPLRISKFQAVCQRNEMPRDIACVECSKIESTFLRLEQCSPSDIGGWDIVFDKSEIH